MPRNRRAIPKAERESAIVAAAGALFGQQGYHATSVADVARAAELTSAAIHWYFPTKDDLFAAVLDQGFGAVTRRVETDPRTAGDPRAQLVELLVRLQPFHNLHRAAHERMGESEAVQAAYTRVNDWLDRHLLDAVAVKAGAAPTGKLAIAGGVLLEGALITGRFRELSVAELVDMLIDALVALSDSA